MARFVMNIGIIALFIWLVLTVGILHAALIYIGASIVLYIIARVLLRLSKK